MKLGENPKMPYPQGGWLPARPTRATFVLSILALVPGLSSPREVPQVDCTIKGDKFRRGYITPELLGADSLVRGGGGGGRDLLERGGRGSRGEGSPPRAGTHPIHREQKNDWRMNNSAHGNVMLSAVNKGISSLNVNSGFPHLTNTQQLQQSGTFTISCQMTVIFLVSQN